MKFISAAVVLASASMAASATVEPRAVAGIINPVEFRNVVTKGQHGGRKNVEYWKAGAVVNGHNDFSMSLSQFTTLEAMYNACYDFCIKHQCKSFDLVPYKQKCYLDTSSNGVVAEKRDLGAAYVKMSAPKPVPVSARPAPTPTPAADAPKCFGIGLHWNSAEPFLVDSLPDNKAVHDALADLCGTDAECGKWYTCANSCGALAVPPDSVLAKRHMGQGVNFAPNRDRAQQNALADCQKRLDAEGMDATCTVVTSFCIPK